MNELQIFNNEEFGEIRTITKDNEPMFCLMDICKALGMKNPTMVASRLEDDEVTKFDLGSKRGETNFVTESGLYAVILRSDKPNAKKFRNYPIASASPWASIVQTELMPVDSGAADVVQYHNMVTSRGECVRVAFNAKDGKLSVNAQYNTITNDNLNGIAIFPVLQ